MTKQTAEAIAAEIESLTRIKPEVPQFTGFGDSNWDAIDAQIAVLKGNLTRDDIDDAWYEDEHVYDSAATARQWLDGEFADSLAGDWESLRGVKVAPLSKSGFLL